MKLLTRLIHPAAAAALVALATAGCSKPPVVAEVAPAAASASANVSDVDITEHVKTALQQADSLKGANITVATVKGDVRLTGIVDSQAQIDDALKIARASEGTHAIHDELTVKK